jgi:penicillin G amidase
MLRRSFKVVVILVVVLGALGIHYVHRLRTGPPIRSGTRSLDGLEAPVEILYDSMGVPHIFAASVEDLFLAQGYVHATHRLWQMEMFRRVLQGRLSEIFGERTLDTDRFLRTIGMGEAARIGTPPPDTPLHRLLEGYARGVNAAISGWRGRLPPEFVLLRFRPEPWTPVLVPGMEKIMAWDLSDYHTGLSLATAREVLGDSALAPLLPRYPEWGVTIVDGWPAEGEDRTGHAAALPVNLPPPTAPDLLAQAVVSGEAARFLELGSIARASNAWVVGGERSRSGKPLLANDMHLSLDAPNIWFLVGLHAPGVDVVGMSLPGAPGVVAGHSAAVAWGFSNAYMDDSDFFLERVNPDDPDQYLTPEGWAPFEIREEVIGVRGGDPVTLTVRTTRHGPVITPVEERARIGVDGRGGTAPTRGDGSDSENGADGEGVGRARIPQEDEGSRHVLAYQWVAHSPAGTLQALLGMAEARNAEEFLRSLRYFDNPHQNVVFADTAGAWGYWMGGRVPLRASGSPPHLPVPGWTGEHDWVGWVPFEEKPHVLAPERGYIATANNAQGRDERARRVTDGNWAPPYRAQRISELLEARDLHDAESLLAIQLDPGSAFVDRNLPHAVEAFRSANLNDLALRLERWDRHASLESTEATLFHTWWATLHLLYRDHYYAGGRSDGEGNRGGRNGGEESRGWRGYFPGRVLEMALEQRPGKRAGDPAEAARWEQEELPPEFPGEAARLAVEFSDLPWGEAQSLTLDHPLASVPLLGQLLRFGRSGIPRVGGPHSVNVNPIGGVRPPFRSGSGPSQRHVVDMANPDGSGGFILPGGQSGYPAHPHAFDQLELWTKGRLWLLPTERSRVEARTVATVRLVPGDG